MSNGAGRDEGNRARLGVFVVSGLVLAAAGALALGWGRIFEKTVPLHCYFSESVQGLDPGSAVSYRGVKIGRVAEIRMAQVRARGNSHDAIIAVRSELFPQALEAFGSSIGTPEEWEALLRREVEHGLRVRVAWKDITGQKYLEVDYLDPAEYRPPELGFAPAQPYLPSAVSPSLQDIQKDLATTLGSLARVDYERLGAQMQQLLDQVTQRVQEFRSDEVSASLRDAADAMRDLARDDGVRKTIARFDQVGADTQALIRRAQELLDKPELDRSVSDFAAAAKSLRTTAESLEASLPEAVARVESVADEARKAIVESNLPLTAEAVRNGVAHMSGASRSVTAVREDLRSALREISEASRNIGRLADFLERNPDAILRGRGAAGGAK